MGMHSEKWLEAVKRANRARTGIKLGPSPELSAARKRNWKDPEYRAKMLEKRKEAAARPEVQEKKSKSMLNTYAEHPELVELRSKQSEKNWAGYSKAKRESISKKQSEHMKVEAQRRWDDPEYRAKMQVVRKEQANRPREKARRRKATKLAWKTGSYRAKNMATRRKTMYSNPAWLKKVSAHKPGKPTWALGYTKETHPSLAKISKTLTGRIPKWNRYGKYYIGKRGKVWMRSTWEIALAEWYDFHDVVWAYEPRYFVVGSGRWRGVTYTPDFYLPKEKQYVEVKGYLNKSNARKMEAFIKQYPEIKLVMFRKDELKAMGVIQ